MRPSATSNVLDTPHSTHLCVFWTLFPQGSSALPQMFSQMRIILDRKTAVKKGREGLVEGPRGARRGYLDSFPSPLAPRASKFFRACSPLCNTDGRLLLISISTAPVHVGFLSRLQELACLALVLQYLLLLAQHAHRVILEN